MTRIVWSGDNKGDAEKFQKAIEKSGMKVKVRKVKGTDKSRRRHDVFEFERHPHWVVVCYD